MNPPAGDRPSQAGAGAVPGPEDRKPLPRRRPLLAYGPGTGHPWQQRLHDPGHHHAPGLWTREVAPLDYQPAPPLADVLTAYALRPWNGRTP